MINALAYPGILAYCAAALNAKRCYRKLSDIQKSYCP